ncbi:MAG TPA: RidA family protein [Gemmatimonadota bacterium]|nr:RidA family protein [Gemmatimonadota bacterium]
MKHGMACLMVLFAAVGPLAPPTVAQQAAHPEARLAELGLELPEPYPPFANYMRAVRVGDLLYLGGHSNCEEPYETGKVGRDRTLEEGYETARLTALCLLATLKAELGDLGRVRRIVRVFGIVNATDDFTQHSQVINGASDLLVEVFGERGRHARAAIGASSLPIGLTLEIEMLVEVEPGMGEAP